MYWIDAVLAYTHSLCFKQQQEKITNFRLKIIIFTTVRNHSILHGRVFCNEISSLYHFDSYPRFPPFLLSWVTFVRRCFRNGMLT